MTLESGSESEPKRHPTTSPGYPKLAYAVRDGVQAVCNTSDQLANFMQQHGVVESCPYRPTQF